MADLFFFNLNTSVGRHSLFSLISLLLCRHIFTADPRGVLKLWDIRNALFSNTLDITTSQKVPLIAVFESSFGARIMCLDAFPQDEVTILELSTFSLKEKSNMLNC